MPIREVSCKSSATSYKARCPIFAFFCLYFHWQLFIMFRGAKRAFKVRGAPKGDVGCCRCCVVVAGDARQHRNRLSTICPAICGDGNGDGVTESPFLWLRLNVVVNANVVDCVVHRPWVVADQPGRSEPQDCAFGDFCVGGSGSGGERLVSGILIFEWVSEVVDFGVVTRG